MSIIPEVGRMKKEDVVFLKKKKRGALAGERPWVHPHYCKTQQDRKRIVVEN
jgi:hypothetical protein